jgi:spore maturation protein SpmA
MIWWVGFMVILTVLSYLNDTGVISFLENVRIPVLEASLLSFLILVGTAGILIRMLLKKRRGEKEGLKERVKRLEQELSKNKL